MTNDTVDDDAAGISDGGDASCNDTHDDCNAAGPDADGTCDDECVQKECHIRLESFDDLVRMACAYLEHPRRIYTFELDGVRVAATLLHLENTLAAMYAPLPPDSDGAQYATYVVERGRESCGASRITSNASSNAPMIHLKSGLTPFDVAGTRDAIPDVFVPVELCDLASLARLTYNPDFPDESELALYAVPVAGSGSWALGYLIMYDMDKSYYGFYHVICDAKPVAPFLRYRHDTDAEPEFTDRVEHGYLYMPIIRVGESHPIFGLGA